VGVHGPREISHHDGGPLEDAHHQEGSIGVVTIDLSGEFDDASLDARLVEEHLSDVTTYVRDIH